MRAPALALAASLAIAAALVATPAASAADAPEVTNGAFDDGDDSWWATEDLVDSVDTSSGAMCVDVPGGTVNPWDAIVGQDSFNLPLDDYVLSFDVSAATADGEPVAVRALMQDPINYATVLDKTVQVGPDSSHFDLGFALSQDYEDRQMAFQIGGATAPWTFCIDNVVLEAGKVLPAYGAETGPRVRVNQVGYLPDAPKRATLVTDQSAPVEWTLLDGSATVASGESVPAPSDPSSLLTVHTIDFSDVTAPGTYTLTADGETSYEFVIGTEAYEQLRTDSLAYFYLARSGTDIDAALVGEDYARDAGHVSTAGGTDTNQGDLAVACQPAGDTTGGDNPQPIYDEPWTCDYTLDVVGGWYDAGDHGKYVVNGGIATAQLLSTYERSLTAASAVQGALDDGTLAIPESSNGIPDVLDEAKWELDFMSSMMVPQGEGYAGMVHHKVHDYGWTGLPLLPAQDPEVRYLHRPSTAATLNLAATAAQGARLFEKYDPAYAEQLLESSRTAWAAALANPEVYAPAADGSNGGGPYDDQNVSDEFYWAAAELFLTTGEEEFLNYVLESPLHERNVFPTGGFSWDSMAAIARMDLATVPSDLPGHDAVVASVLAGADGILAEQSRQPFGQPLAANQFVWGSNSQILNNIVVLGTAYDLSGDEKYRDGALESLDYVLGRNALNMSYVTGYGTQYAQNQHSRWFANQLNRELPHPPAGSVAGGPNAKTETWDPVANELFAAGCAPQFCYVDDIQSWATNEITVNWNSALSWVASFAADQGSAEGGAQAAGSSDTSDNSWFVLLLALAVNGAGVAYVLYLSRDDKDPEH
ncbi:glycoside hydrolase family 9 protein [Demequina aurantiaca]|uniref:glycoside hydrolase family 9 protein n=1 Tax=Demequina aurantiaca TaxID=676200 RepID=UPI003D341ACD